MQHVRLGCVAYVLFALACVLPGWWLRDIIAAEMQLRGLRAISGRGKPRKLGPSGVYYLCKILSETPDRAPHDAAEELVWEKSGLPANTDARHFRASWLLSKYDDPLVLRDWVQALPPTEDEGFLLGLAGWDGTEHRDRVAAFIDAMSDDCLRGVLKSCSGSSSSVVNISPSNLPTGNLREGWFLWVLWSVRPERCGRIVGDILGSTSHAELAWYVASPGYCKSKGYCRFIWKSFDACAWGNRERRLGAIRAGLSNPNEAVRKVCEKALTEPEPLEGGNSYDTSKWRQNDGR